MARPSVIIDIIHSGEAFEVAQEVKIKEQRMSLRSCKAPSSNIDSLGKCTRCGYIASNELCKACTLLEGLERGIPQLGIVRLPSCQVLDYSLILLKKDGKKKRVEVEAPETSTTELRTIPMFQLPPILHNAQPSNKSLPVAAEIAL